MPKIKKQQKKDYFIHPTAIIEDDVQIGTGTKVWHYSHIRQNTKIGQNCIVGSGVFIDVESKIGDNVKIQNRAIIYHEAIIENGVFIGPNVCFTNDKIPRAVNPDGSLKLADDWEVSTIKIGEGSAIGAHSVITPGVTIGKWALVGSGSVVTKDLPDFAMAFGNPARISDFVCKCGQRLKEEISRDEENIKFRCNCGLEITIPKKDYKLKSEPPTEEKLKVWLR